MVALNSLALLSLAAAGTLAAPTWSSQQCMTDDQANVVAEKYGELIASYTDELAEALLTTDFTDWSESVNTLINSCPQGDAAMTLPLLAATFDNREEFQIGQGQQPHINFKQLQLWNACNSVIIRWETTNTANITDVKPVIGLIVMDTVKAPVGSQYPYLINRVYSEFDAGAWLQNLQEAGICAKKECGSAPAPGKPGPAPAPGQPQPAPSQPQPAPGKPQPNNPAPAPEQPQTQSWSASHSEQTWTTVVPPPSHTPTTAWGNYTTTALTSTQPTTWTHNTAPTPKTSSTWSTPTTWSHSSSSSSSGWRHSKSSSEIWSNSTSSSATWSTSSPITTVWTTSTKTSSHDEPSSSSWSAPKSYGTGNW